MDEVLNLIPRFIRAFLYFLGPLHIEFLKLNNREPFEVRAPFLGPSVLVFNQLCQAARSLHVLYSFRYFIGMRKGTFGHFISQEHSLQIHLT